MTYFDQYLQLPLRFITAMGLCGVCVISGCRLNPEIDAPAPVTESTQDLAIANADQARLFSDKDELPKSSSVVELKANQKSLRFRYDIDKYGGFAIPLASVDLRKYGSLSFKARQISGSTKTVQIQFSNADGVRSKTAITESLEGLGSAWRQVEVPLGQFLMFNAQSLKDVNELAVIFIKGKGEIDLSSITLHARQGGVPLPAAPPPPVKSNAEFPPGHAAWTYGSAPYVFDRVTQYNQTAEDDQKIRYLFPLAGSVSFVKGKAVLSWYPEKAIAIADAFKAAGHTEVNILPMIDGLSHGVENMTDEAWDQAAETLAAKINDDRWMGVQFDIEPHDDRVFFLFSKLRDYTTKPVTAAVGRGTVDLFRYTDLAVLMAYDWNTNPDAFARQAKKRIPTFLDFARRGQGRAMIGVPFIATHHEYEQISPTQTGSAVSSGHAMVDFANASHKAVTTYSNPYASGYLGMSVWAIHEQKGLHGPRDTEWYFPTEISIPLWDLLRTGPSSSHE